MAPEEMGSAELVRWMSRLESDMQGIRSDIRSLAFVHPDVYNANRASDERRMLELEKRVDTEAEGRRTISRGVVLALIGTVVNIVFMLAIQGVAR